MGYQKQEWRNNDESTPISAERLTHMEEGIAAAVEGTTGPQGPAGEPGPQGPPGADGVSVFDAVSPTGSAESDRAAVIAASTAAAEAGEPVVRLADGDWALDGLEPGDISDRVLLLESGSVSSASNVRPVTGAQIASVTRASTIAGGRGRVALHVDDATPQQWESLFPLAQSLGITLGVAWHTANGAGWMPEAHRHGWEILAHLPDNTRATDALAAGTLDQLAAESRDAVRAVTGQKRPGFVYPQHARSLATDEVLAKYFAFGRGVAEDRLYPRGAPHPWLTAGMPLDAEFTASGLSEKAKRVLRIVAATGADLVGYLHWDAPIANGNGPRGLRELVAYARSLGIEVVNPSQVWGDRNIVDDPHFEDTSQWTLSGHASWDESKSYHGGRSIKFSDPSGGTVSGRVVAARYTPLSSQPGMFTMLRVSYRVHAPTAVSTTLGAELYGAFAVRKANGDSMTIGSLQRIGGTTPATGTTIQADGWERQTHVVYLAPNIYAGSFAISVNNLAAGSELWIDDFRIEPLGNVSYAAYEAQLIGTGNVFVNTNNPSGATLADVQVIPQSPPVGTITATPSGTHRWRLTSTSAEDRMKVTLRLQPRDQFYDAPPTSSQGA